MLWKLNAAFPSVIWQIYDWYLEPNAGYYFMQNSCEPVHIQLNPLDYNVTVLNRTYQGVPNLTVEADVYGIDSKPLFRQTAKVSLSVSDVKESFSLTKVLTDSKGVNFVVLNLKNAGGKIISHNVYWLSANNDYTALNSMPRTKVETTVLKREILKTETKWTLKFTNKTKQLAFFINPQLLGEGEEIMPCFWSSNYFSLAAGESTTVSVSVSTVTIKGKSLEIKVKGWNLDNVLIPLK
jgi:hypothetical protein